MSADTDNEEKLKVELEIAERLGVVLVTINTLGSHEVFGSCRSRRSVSSSPSTSVVPAKKARTSCDGRMDAPGATRSCTGSANGTNSVKSRSPVNKATEVLAPLQPYLPFLPPDLLLCDFQHQEKLLNALNATGIMLVSHVMQCNIAMSPADPELPCMETDHLLALLNEPSTPLPQLYENGNDEIQRRIQNDWFEVHLVERVEQAYDALMELSDTSVSPVETTNAYTREAIANAVSLFSATAVRRPPTRTIESVMATGQEGPAAGNHSETTEDPNGSKFNWDHNYFFSQFGVDSVLCLACVTGSAELAECVVELRGGSTEFHAQGNDSSPLLEAAAAGSKAVVEKLISLGADVNKLSGTQNSALHYASAAGYAEVADVLLATGKCDVGIRNDNGHDALMEAASAGHVYIARALVAKGAVSSFHAVSTEFKESPLTLAAYKGHVEMVKYLLTIKNAPGENSEEELHTALMEASMDGHIEVCRLLLFAGAPVNLNCEAYESPLTLACCGGHPELATLLLDHDAYIEETNEESYTPLMEAAREGHARVVKVLLDRGAQVNAQTEETGETAMTVAACGGYIDVLEVLLSYGADVELGANTPLMEASQEGHVEAVMFLLMATKKLFDEGKYARMEQHTNMAMGMAAENGHMDCVVEILTNSDADVNVEIEGRTPLMKAAKSGFSEIVDYLIHKGADVNYRSSQQDATALYLACAGGHKDCVRILLQAGADVNIDLKDGVTCALEAARSGFGEIIQLLLEHTGTPAVTRPDGQGDSRLQAPPAPPTTPTTLQQKARRGKKVKHSLTIPSGSCPPGIGPNSMGVNDPYFEAFANPVIPAEMFSNQEWMRAYYSWLANSHNAKVSATQQIPVTLPSSLSLEEIAIHVDMLQRQLISITEGDQAAPQLAASISSTFNPDATVPNPLAASMVPAGSAAATAHAEAMGAPTVAVAPAMHGFAPGSQATAQVCVPMKHFPPVTSADPASLQVPVPVPDCFAGSTGNVPTSSVGPSGSSLGNSAGPMRPGLVMPQTVCPHPGQAIPPYIPMPNIGFPPTSPDTPCTVTASVLNSSFHQMMISMNAQVPSVVNRLNVNGSLTPAAHDLITDPPIYLPLMDAAQAEHVNDGLKDKLETHFSQEQLKNPVPSGKQKAIYEYLKNYLDVLMQSDQEARELSAKLLDDQMRGMANAADSVTTPVARLPRTPAALVPVLNTPLVTFPPIPVVSNPADAKNPGSSVPSVVSTQPPSSVPTQTPTIPTVPPAAAVCSSATTATDAVFSANQNKNPSTDEKLTSRNELETLLKDVCVANYASEEHKQLSCKVLQDLLLRGDVDQETYLSTVDKLVREIGIKPVIEALRADHDVGQAVLEQQSAALSQTLNILRPTVTSLPGGVISHAHPQTATATPPNTTQPVLATRSTSQPSNLRRTHSEGDDVECKNTTTPRSTFNVDKATESNNDTPLTVACSNGHTNAVGILVRSGANIEHKDKKGFTPLILAATGGHVAVVELLLNNGAQIEAQSERTKDTALSLACSGGRKEVVELLLKRGANKEHRNVSDYTPLSLAASGGYVDIINMLLNAGAEINSRTGSKLGISPLMLAAMNGHREATRVLLERGSDINAQIETNRNTALTLACFQGRTEVVRLLLQYHANVEHRAKTGLTPLMEAANGGYVEVGELLLDHYADPNTAPVPSSRDTALTIAADKGHDKFVEMLINRSAIIDARNKKGCTALWLACHGGHLETVKTMVKHQADVDAQDNRKVSPLMIAFRKGHIKVVQFMVNVVKQFPNDLELGRYLSTLLLTDVEVIKNCEEAKKIITNAKEAKEEQAEKAAERLLAELELEEKQAASKKQAKAAKKRKKQKRVVMNSKDDGRDTKEVSDDESEESNMKKPPVVEEKVVVTATATAATPEPQESPSKDDQDRVPMLAPATLPEPVRSPVEKEKTAARSRRQRQQDSKRANVSSVSEPVPVNKVVVMSPVPSTRTQPLSSPAGKGSSSGEEWVKANNKKKQVAGRRLNASTVGQPGGSQKDFYADDNGTYGGWNNVELSRRKLWTLSVSSAAIARVIGRGGANINAIREATGASIEVEKQSNRKEQHDRTISIRGTQDTVSKATAMINALIQDSEITVLDVIRHITRGNSSVASSSSESGSRVGSQSEVCRAPMVSAKPPTVTPHTNVWQMRMAQRQQQECQTSTSASPLKDDIVDTTTTAVTTATATALMTTEEKNEESQPVKNKTPNCIPTPATPTRVQQPVVEEPVSTVVSNVPVPSVPAAADPKEEDLRKAPGYRIPNSPAHEPAPRLVEAVRPIEKPVEKPVKIDAEEEIKTRVDERTLSHAHSLSFSREPATVFPSATVRDRSVLKQNEDVLTSMAKDPFVAPYAKIADIWKTDGRSCEQSEAPWSSQLFPPSIPTCAAADWAVNEASLLFGGMSLSKPANMIQHTHMNASQQLHMNALQAHLNATQQPHMNATQQSHLNASQQQQQQQQLEAAPHPQSQISRPVVNASSSIYHPSIGSKRFSPIPSSIPTSRASETSVTSTTSSDWTVPKTLAMYPPSRATPQQHNTSRAPSQGLNLQQLSTGQASRSTGAEHNIFTQLADQLLRHSASSATTTSSIAPSNYYGSPSYTDHAAALPGLPLTTVTQHSTPKTFPSYQPSDIDQLSSLLGFQPSTISNTDYNNQYGSRSNNASVPQSRLPSSYAPPPGFGNIPPPNAISSLPSPPTPAVRPFYNSQLPPPGHPTTAAPFASYNNSSQQQAAAAQATWNPPTKNGPTWPSGWN